MAKRTPAAATAAQQQLRHAAANASPMGRFQAKPSPGVGGGGTSPSAAGAGGRGGGGSASFGSGSAGGGGDDAVWEALQAAYDATGRRRHSGVREVLEAVRGLGYGARVVSNGGGGSDASAMEASQVWLRSGLGAGLGGGRAWGLIRAMTISVRLCGGGRCQPFA